MHSCPHSTACPCSRRCHHSVKQLVLRLLGQARFARMPQTACSARADTQRAGKARRLSALEAIQSVLWISPAAEGMARCVHVTVINSALEKNAGILALHGIYLRESCNARGRDMTVLACSVSLIKRQLGSVHHATIAILSSLVITTRGLRPCRRATRSRRKRRGNGRSITFVEEGAGVQKTYARLLSHTPALSRARTIAC